MKRTTAVMTMLGCAWVLAANGCKKGGGADEELPVDNTPVVHSAISPKPPKGCGSGFFGVHYGKAYETLRDAEEYKPGRDY